MLLRLLLVVSMISLGLVISPTSTYACSCAPPGTPAEELAGSSLVFRGTVTSIGTPDEDGRLSIDFDVETVWKGPQSETITLTTHRDSAACGYPFEAGVDYVVYSWDGVDVGRCGRTAPVELAGEDLAAFDGGVQGTGDSGFPNTGVGGFVGDDSEQDKQSAILVIGVATALILGIAGLRLYLRRQETKQEPTNVDCT